LHFTVILTRVCDGVDTKIVELMLALNAFQTDGFERNGTGPDQKKVPADSVLDVAENEDVHEPVGQNHGDELPYHGNPFMRFALIRFLFMSPT